jgi:hypothetical protein
MISIAQRDICAIATTYGQLQVGDRINIEGQMCTITVLVHTADYSIVTCKGDYYGVISYGKPSSQPVTRSARNTA